MVRHMQTVKTGHGDLSARDGNDLLLRGRVMSDPGTDVRPRAFLALFSGFRLQIGGRDAALRPRKAEALLTYLAMQDGYSAPREAIIDLLWTDRGP